jgi:hypothetical protein
MQLLELPVEILDIILGYCRLEDLCEIGIVCQSMREIARRIVKFDRRVTSYHKFNDERIPLFLMAKLEIPTTEYVSMKFYSLNPREITSKIPPNSVPGTVSNLAECIDYKSLVAEDIKSIVTLKYRRLCVRRIREDWKWSWGIGKKGDVKVIRGFQDESDIAHIIYTAISHYLDLPDYEKLKNRPLRRTKNFRRELRDDEDPGDDEDSPEEEETESSSSSGESGSESFSEEEEEDEEE